jgi:TfoX/Sxy family transcriptional regulator of competence genes
VAYDMELAERIRAYFEADPAVTERAMFGGLCVMVHGHMAVGVVGDDLMVRVGPAAWASALERPHAREMNFTGRSLRGMVFVGEGGTRDDASLATWIERSLAFVETLPPK